MNSLVLQLALAVIPAILAITLHEAAHGYAALALGDDTARQAGRLSLNPLRHVDRVGTILLPGLLLIFQLLTIHRVLFMFGWAKPVPVSAWKFRDPRRGMAVVATAGPAMNFLLAWIAALLLPRPETLGEGGADYLDAAISQSPLVGLFLFYFILTNLVLGLFNLIPIPPLDGGRIAVGILPLDLARWWARLERVGILLVIALLLLPHLVPGVDPLGDALETVVPWAINLVLRLAGHDVGAGADVRIETDSLVLRLEGFEGPLDLLLDLARAQKVDLAKISILALVEQFLAVIEGARRVRLELAADWLVMAAWLTWLKSRLLLPEGAEAEEGEQAADALATRLRDLSAMRAAAGWLAGRPQLGQDVFARGAPEDHTEIDRSRLALDLGSLVGAYLQAMRRRVRSRRYQPRPLTLWSVKEALERLSAMLGSLPDWVSLDEFLPDTLGSSLQRRAALASTLLAGLEMARGGAIRLRQEHAFGPILVRRRADGAVEESA